MGAPQATVPGVAWICAPGMVARLKVEVGPKFLPYHRVHGHHFPRSGVVIYLSTCQPVSLYPGSQTDFSLGAEGDGQSASQCSYYHALLREV